MLRVGLGPLSPYWLCLNVGQDQALCFVQRETCVEQVLPSSKLKGPRMQGKQEVQAPNSLQVRPGSHSAFTPHSNPQHSGRSCSWLYPENGYGCNEQQVGCESNIELTKPEPHTAGRDPGRGLTKVALFLSESHGDPQGPPKGMSLHWKE